MWRAIRALLCELPWPGTRHNWRLQLPSFVALLVLSHLVLPAAIPLRLVLLVAGADLFGLNIITVCGQAFQAFEELKWTAAINVLISAMRLIGAVILIRIQGHPSALQWGYVYFFSTAAVAITAFMLVWTKLGPPRFTDLLPGAEAREGYLLFRKPERADYLQRH